MRCIPLYRLILRCHHTSAWCFFVATYLLIATAEPEAFTHKRTDDAYHGRHLLQRGGDLEGNNRSDDPAKFTGDLALYSLFGLLVFASACVCVLGIIVTVQWPNPSACCYRTPHSDLPSSESCGCCALHRLNIGFAVTWLALLVLLILAFIIYLMAAAAVLAIAHTVIAYRLIRQLRASYAASAQMQMTAAMIDPRALPGLVTGVVVDRPLPGVPVPGIPVIDIPLTVAVVDAQLQTHINYDEQAAAQRAQAAAAAAAASGVGDQSSRSQLILSQNRLSCSVGAAAASAAPGASPDGEGGASGSKWLMEVPIAPVVDGRNARAQVSQSQVLQPQRSVRAWGSPGASTSGAAGEAGPGPSRETWSSPVVPQMGSSATNAAAHGPLHIGFGGWEGLAAAASEPSRGTTAQDAPLLPGSPGSGWR